MDLLHRPRRQLGALGEQGPLLRVLGEQRHRAAELVAGGVGAGDQHRHGHAHQLLGRQAVARLLGGDEIGQEVVGRLRAAPLDHLAHVRADLVLGGAMTAGPR